MKQKPRHRLLRKTLATSGPFAGMQMVSCRCGEWPPPDSGFRDDQDLKAAYQLHLKEVIGQGRGGTRI